MAQFPVHSLETAPAGSRPALVALEESVGMIPNLAAAMAGSPALIGGFVALRASYIGSSLDSREREVLSLSNALANGCAYCVAIHSTFALGAGVESETVAALRAGRMPAEPRAAALVRFSRALIERRGAASESQIAEFLASGFSETQALDVVLGLAVSVLANYARHVTGAPLDEALEPQRWEPPASEHSKVGAQA